ncbi:MAG TPA: serine/threonine-protein kinase, partial [Gemmataceae bacterium]|nr:serine/threonine-protein kinase [Gemmataceae bacterium]
MNQQTFLECLRESGLLEQERLAEVLGSLPPSVDPFIIADVLLKKGLLTSYQLQRIWAGQTKGLILGQYRILDELGRGGFGRVYKAVHGLMKRTVALKVIAPEFAREPEAAALFRREMLAATGLYHPNIVMAYDADEIDGVLFLAMEFVGGPSLQQLLAETGPLPIARSCSIMRQAAHGLLHAHEKGMVHRDIKPANLLLPSGETADSLGGGFRLGTPLTEKVLVKIADFGLARLCAANTGNTNTLFDKGTCVGTPTYVSPEQARNVHHADIRSDLYSLGCTFYLALTGQLPFQGTTVAELLAQHREQEPRPVEQLRPDIPLPLASVVRRLMAKKPEHRFQTPAELISELGFVQALNLQSEPPAVWRSPGNTAAGQAEAQAPVGRNGASMNAVKLTAPPASEGADASEHIRPAYATQRWRKPLTPKVHVELAASAHRDLLPSAPPEEPPQSARETVAKASSTTVVANTDEAEHDCGWEELWRAWSCIVERVTAGDWPLSDDGSYGKLYERLTDALQCQVTKDSANVHPAVKRALNLAEPWVSLSALTGLDRKSLRSLSDSCQSLNCALAPAPKKVGRHRLAMCLLFCLLAGLPAACW